MSGTPCWRIGDVDYDLRRAFREVDPTEVITASGDVSVGGPAVGHIRVNETEAGYIIMSFIDEIGKSGLIMSIASEEPYLLTPSEEPKSDFIKEIVVDSGRMLKRIHTAPQGRAHRIRKRSNHVTLIIDDRNRQEIEEESEEVEGTEEENTEETTE